MRFEEGRFLSGIFTGARAHDPDNDDEREEPKGVEDHCKTFEDRKLADRRGVEENGCENECHREQRPMPPLDNVIPIADRNERQYLLRARVSDRGHGALPAERREPADGERELLLHVPRCELGHPVILAYSTVGGCPWGLKYDYVSPPDVGAIDAISARLSITMAIPQHTTNVNHIAPAVPPLDIEKAPRTKLNSQVSPRTTT